MNFSDYVEIEGTELSSILCYGVFPPKYLDKIDVDLNIINSDFQRNYKLSDPEWPCGILLTEFQLVDFKYFGGQVCESLSAMFDTGPCLGAACMYDGAFMDYTDIFSNEFSNRFMHFLLLLIA
ncbi:hypothetical protein VC279_23745 [Xanthomonas sp. WHRI 10064A]|uniref:hypothetical protein n=1 Tax=unclassified Xanthomonas TaxID=2643310 RepID=UPI002B237742|nr:MULTISPECIES: hypothetical protein [unclassified Xanthomonas]MEA9590131.1 hypothetical protein [Xanthomonas sp. WHRI 10064B]MEA9617601.1 hypothetical protein [Xanthomonas sp. WHRI 10064A]